MVVEDMEESGCGLFGDAIPAYTTRTLLGLLADLETKARPRERNKAYDNSDVGFEVRT